MKATIADTTALTMALQMALNATSFQSSFSIYSASKFQRTNCYK